MRESKPCKMYVTTIPSSTYREYRKISIPTDNARMIVRMLRTRVPTVLKLEKRQVLTIITLRNPTSTISSPE